MENSTNIKLRRLNYIISEMNGIYHKAAYKFGLSDSTLMILYSICIHGTSCMLIDIYKSSGVCRQTINSSIRKLERENIIYLESIGGKKKKVYLTDKGKKLSERTSILLIEAENRILESWTESDVDLYLKLNEKYSKSLEEQLEHILSDKGGKDGNEQ